MTASNDPSGDLQVVASVLQLAIHGRHDVRDTLDVKALANEAYERIRKLERITDKLVSLVAEMQ